MYFQLCFVSQAIVVGNCEFVKCADAGLWRWHFFAYQGSFCSSCPGFPLLLSYLTVAAKMDINIHDFYPTVFHLWLPAA